jgi:hypothetical protein
MHEEGDRFHQRVLESVQREGVLQQTLLAMHGELSQLRASMDLMVAQGPAQPAQVAVPAAPSPEAYSFDVGLVQRVFAAAGAYEVADAVAVAGIGPAAQSLESPAPAAPAAPAMRSTPLPEPLAPAATVPPSTWVVREIQVDEPSTALTMRILDLTAEPPPVAAPAVEPAAEPARSDPWQVFARPA